VIETLEHEEGCVSSSRSSKYPTQFGETLPFPFRITQLDGLIEVMQIPIQSTLPPRRLVSPQKLSKNTTRGIAIQLIGMLLCWTVVGAIVGVPLIIVGRRMTAEPVME